MKILTDTKTNSDNNIAALDNLRAIAIILVLLFHYRLFEHPDWVDDLGAFGWTGVDLFFVLSGYLISSQLFREICASGQINIKKFYLKRAFRILPAYFLILTLYFTVAGFKERDGLRPLWRYLTFTQNYGLNLGQSHAFTHAWSLCIEEQFYFLLPIILSCLLYLKRIKAGALLIGTIWVAGFFIRNFDWLHFVAPAVNQENAGIVWYEYIYYPSHNRLDGLLTGISIAAIFQFSSTLKARILKYGNLLMLVALLLITAAYIVCQNPFLRMASVFGFPLVSLAYGVLLMALLSPNGILYNMRSRVFSIVATLSYSLYLSHKAAFHFVQGLSDVLSIEKNSNLMFAICIIAATVAACIIYYTIERPFMRLRDRILLQATKEALEPAI